MRVRIINGTWRTGSNAVTIQDKTFTLVKEWYVGTDNRYKIGIQGTPELGLPSRTCYIFVEKGDFEYLSDDGDIIEAPSLSKSLPTSTDYEKLLLDNETDDEAMSRIRDTFSMFDEIVTSVCNGIIRGLIVCGPAGIGKSHGVERILRQKSISNPLRGITDEKYDVISGYVSPINVYKALYNHAEKGHVIVFDDCDDAFLDDTAMNILKAALDTKKRREIHWLAESRVLKDMDIPNHFEFKGSVIFLTNYDFENTTSPKLRAHMDAILSRCHYLDLAISNQRDIILRIKQVVMDGMLRDYCFSDHTVAQILNYVDTHADVFRELSLRTVTKIADFVKAFPTSWQPKVEASCLKRQARFRRLLEHKNMMSIDIPVEDELTLS